MGLTSLFLLKVEGNGLGRRLDCRLGVAEEVVRAISVIGIAGLLEARTVDDVTSSSVIVAGIVGLLESGIDDNEGVTAAVAVGIAGALESVTEGLVVSEAAPEAGIVASPEFALRLRRGICSDGP